MGRKGKVDRAWLHRHVSDPYVRQAQQHGYRSRAAYKLCEIDDRDRLVRPGMTVVDLGSAPGAWSQVLRERLGTTGGRVQGRIVALDMLPMEPLPDVEFIAGDFREAEVLARLEEHLGGARVDLVVSDMAPNLSGIAVADAARMADLIELALQFARQHLTPEGALVAKCFHGSGYTQAVEGFRAVFRRVVARKPAASRAASAETFLVGRGLRDTAAGRP